MKEETKEEYLARLRKENGTEESKAVSEEELAGEPPWKARLKSLFFLALFLLFMWGVYMIFGMMKSN